jgi:hypothetical protein
MALFEWLGEIFDPGPVGNIDSNATPLIQEGTKRIWVILSIIIGFGVLSYLIWAVFTSDSRLTFSAVLIIYLLISYVFTPNPDSSNMGWFGGLMNNPFRISDNFNRFLLFAYILMLPGKLIVFAIQALYKLIKYNL